MKIKVGTRGSKLALHQTRQVIELIRQQQPNIEVEEVIIKTLGDKVTDLPLFKVGGQGLFIKEIEQALLDERIDIAVHSLKDVPHQVAEGLKLVDFGLPQDARDCFVSYKYKNLNSLPPGALIGTSSLRRRAQLAYMRPDLKFSDFRGNLDTRLKKLKQGEVDAIIVAAAGLIRSNQTDHIGELFDIDKLTPAAGQGIIAIECRTKDYQKIVPILKKFHDRNSYLRAVCERAFLREIQGGCQTPMAVHATINEATISLHSFIGSADGLRTLRRVDLAPIDEAEQLAIKAAQSLIKAGGVELLVNPLKEN